MSSYTCEIEAGFKKYYGALCYFASRYVSDGGEVVEDLVQDCFVRLLEREVSFESEDYLRNYLYVAVRNNCLNYLRRNRTAGCRVEDMCLPDAPSEELCDEIFSAEVVRCLADHIDHLPTQCRQVIRLSYIEGLDNETVAGCMGLSVNTIRAQKMRGKRLLRLSFNKAVL